MAVKKENVNWFQNDYGIAHDLGIDTIDLYNRGIPVKQAVADAIAGGDASKLDMIRLQKAINAGAKLSDERLVLAGVDEGMHYEAVRDFIMPDGTKVGMGELGVNRTVDHNGAIQLVMTAKGGGDLMFDVGFDPRTGELGKVTQDTQFLVDTGESSGLGGLVDKYGMSAALAYMTAGLGAELGAATGTGAAGGNAMLSGGISAAQGNDLEQVLTNAAIGGAAGAYSDSTNAVGGVTGPDNIDVGGGFNPASGATAEQLAAAYYGVPEGSQYVAPEVGPGTQLAELAPTTVSDAGTGSTLGEVATGNADKAALYGDAGYGAGMTGAETSAFDTGLAAGGAAAASAAGAGAGAGAGAAAGSKLADILPYTTGASVVASLLQADAAKSAADQQSAAAQAAIAQQQKNFETINAQQAPYRAAGYNALNNIAGMTAGQTPKYDANGNIIKDANGNPVMTTGSGYFQHQFDANDLKSGLAPNYDFMLQQGQMANQRAANMGGGALGGNALQGLNKYTQDYAGNAYQNAFNNYQTQRGNIYNTLAGIAGIGQTGQNATNTAATNATNAASQLGVGSAAAQAAGTVGSANAYGNALNNVTNQYTLAALLNQGGRIG